MRCQDSYSLVVAIIVLSMFLSSNQAEEVNEHRRIKRKVVFTKNSKIFFRVNGKLNVVPWVQVFAYGYAVRVNWDLPETLYRRHKFFKRDLHTELEKIQFDRSENYQTYACLFSYMCTQLSRISLNGDGKDENGKCGILCSIGRIVSQSSGIEADFFKSILNKCSYYIQTCSNPNKTV